MRLQMPSFTNLGDLIRRDRNLEKVAVIDLGGEQAPREFTYAHLDAMANAIARALARGGSAGLERAGVSQLTRRSSNVHVQVT
jgi:long-chain acyl-CoA synthetase